MNELLRAIKQLKQDVYLGEIIKIWTTLSPSQKEDLMLQAIRASSLSQEIDRFRGTPTAR